MRIWEGNKWKKAFSTCYGHFEYQLIAFGISNTPASFEGFIKKILAEKLDIFIIIYFDNIFIYIKDLDQNHIDAIRWLWEQLQKYGLYINLKKCHFH